MVITKAIVEMTNWNIPLMPRAKLGYSGENAVCDFIVKTIPEENYIYYLELLPTEGEANTILLTPDTVNECIKVNLTSEMLGASGIKKAQIVAYIGTEEEPIKKSNVFELEVDNSINATKSVESHYQTALSQWAQILASFNPVKILNKLAEMEEEVDNKQNKLTAGYGINLNAPTDEISVNTEEIATKDYVISKQPTDTAKGNAITLTDSASSPLDELYIMGKSTQNGTPTIDNPIPIIDITAEEIEVKQKNLLTLAQVNKNNLYKVNCTYTYNPTNIEYEITATGTNVILGDFRQTGQSVGDWLFNNSIIKTRVEGGKTYTLTSKNKLFSRFLCFTFGDDRTVLSAPQVSMDGTITIPSGANWLGIRADILNATVDTTYKDMIMVSASGTSYEPPMTPQTANLDIVLRGIPVSSGGNYTDNNNQQWLCDTIERYADGTGKLIRRVGVVDNSLWTMSNVASGTVGERYLMPTTAVITAPIISNYYPQSSSDPYQVEGDYMAMRGNGNIWLRCKDKVFGNITAMKEWASANLVTIYGLQSADYSETPLTAEQLAELDLSTYYPTTNINSNADVVVEYVADIQNYIDKKTSALQNAILSLGGNI